MALTPQQQQLLLLATARQRQAQAQQGQTQQPAAQGAPQAQQQPAQTPAPVEIQQQAPPADNLGVGGDAISFLNNLGDQASFGLAPAAQRAIYNFFSPGSGDQLQAKIDSVNQQHPAGAAAGTVASIPVDMALAAPLAEVAPAMPAVNAFLRGGGVVGNIARVATTGAVTGAVNAATHGGDPLSGAAVGAVLGPVGAAAAKPVSLIAEKLITPAATKAWRYLAGKLGENPDDMIRHIQQYMADTAGKQPSLQQIMSDHDSGVIAKFGSDFPHAGEVLRSGAQASDQALPAAAQDVINNARQTLPAPPTLLRGTNPATASHADLLNGRDTATDTAMAPLRTQSVQLDDELKGTINRSGVISGRQWRPLQRRMMDDTLTLDDADKIRRKAAKVNSGSAVFNPDIHELSNDLDSTIREQVPAYGDLMDKYAEASRYADSFAHGASGAERGAAADAGLRASLATAEGENGYKAGALSRTAAQAGGSPAAAAGVLGDISRPGTAQMAFQSTAGAAAGPAADAAAALRTAGERARATAPGALHPQPDSSAGAANIATGLGSLVMGAPISAGRNTGRGVFQMVTSFAHNISTGQQREIANALVSTVPAVRDAAIEHLRRAGVSDARLKLISGLVSANAARNATNYQTPDNVSDGVVVRMGARG